MKNNSVQTSIMLSIKPIGTKQRGNVECRNANKVMGANMRQQCVSHYFVALKLSANLETQQNNAYALTLGLINLG